MRPAIATVCLSGTLREKLEAIAAARFTDVELFEADFLAYGGSPAELRRLVADLGLRIITYQPFRDFEGLPDARRAKALSRAEHKFDLMRELDCDVMLICSNIAPDALGGVDRAAADFRALGDLAAPRGIRVGYEALAWGRHVNDYRDAWEIVRRADHPSIGLVLDSFHVLVRGTDLTPIRSIPKDRITLVQIADAPRLQMDYLSWSRHYRCLPGQGDLPIDDFMEALQATGFDGLVSLEIFSDRFRAGSVRSVAVDGQRSLLFMLDQLRRRTGVPVKGLPDLPAQAVCHGVEFVEFALNENTVAGFEAVLAGLGFAKVGKHRSKAVTRWRQGDVNLVVNADPGGFARSFNRTHGTSVCAVALKVDDAQNAVARARALLDQEFHQDVAPGELDVPAVRGLGGSLLYFVDHKSGLDRLWEIDFEPIGSDALHAQAGLTSFDHLSQTMQHEEMLTWLLFYTSLFEMRKTPVQDVIDPGGVVQSQVVETPDGACRLILNASQSRQTLSSRFLSDLFGSGMQHIALATSDIVATAARLRANGVEMLPIPANYYDDLEARFDLSTEQIAWARDHGVLYDQDGTAEYFQIYTRTLEGGFFFEIVERRGYAGFGAANAPIRLAAQTHLADDPAQALEHSETASEEA